MGFIRQQEEKLAVRFLSWQYEKLKKPIPDEADLANQAARIVEEAHRIARERGRNVVSIIKDLIAEIKKIAPFCDRLMNKSNLKFNIKGDLTCRTLGLKNYPVRRIAIGAIKKWHQMTREFSLF